MYRAYADADGEAPAVVVDDEEEDAPAAVAEDDEGAKEPEIDVWVLAGYRNLKVILCNCQLIDSSMISWSNNGVCGIRVRACVCEHVLAGKSNCVCEYVCACVREWLEWVID